MQEEVTRNELSKRVLGCHSFVRGPTSVYDRFPCIDTLRSLMLNQADGSIGGSIALVESLRLQVKDWDGNSLLYGLLTAG